MSGVVIISDPQFEAEVLKADQTVLLYFWASWCGPCRLMVPVMDSISTTYGDRLKVMKMEVDPNPEAVAFCRVEGVPALRLFQNGVVVASSEGAISKQRVEDFLQPHLAA